jgi:hypothetical protein
VYSWKANKKERVFKEKRRADPEMQMTGAFNLSLVSALNINVPLLGEPG